MATLLIRKAGFSSEKAQTGAVMLIKRFGSALDLTVHCHTLFLEGECVERPDGSLREGVDQHRAYQTDPRLCLPYRSISYRIAERHLRVHLNSLESDWPVLADSGLSQSAKKPAAMR
jgi:hypothetical protein